MEASPDAAGPTISVVIPAINEAELISQAVLSAWEAGPCEVMMVDGGSQDATRELAAAAGARVMLSRPGRAEQQNVGAAAAKGDVLVFLHADCQLTPSCLRQIRACLAADSSAFAGGFRQQIDAPQWRFRWLERGNAFRLRWLGLAYGDQGIFLRREMFQRLGGFPPEPLMEDVILMRRLRRWGRLRLLAGPLRVSPRRWQHQGVVRQTLRNWALLAAFAAGVSPGRLARFYRRHDRDGVRAEAGK